MHKPSEKSIVPLLTGSYFQQILNTEAETTIFAPGVETCFVVIIKGPSGQRSVGHIDTFRGISDNIALLLKNISLPDRSTTKVLVIGGQGNILHLPCSALDDSSVLQAQITKALLAKGLPADNISLEEFRYECSTTLIVKAFLQPILAFLVAASFTSLSFSAAFALTTVHAYLAFLVNNLIEKRTENSSGEVLSDAREKASYLILCSKVVCAVMIFSATTSNFMGIATLICFYLPVVLEGILSACVEAIFPEKAEQLNVSISFSADADVTLFCKPGRLTKSVESSILSALPHETSRIAFSRMNKNPHTSAGCSLFSVDPMHVPGLQSDYGLTSDEKRTYSF